MNDPDIPGRSPSPDRAHDLPEAPNSAVDRDFVALSYAVMDTHDYKDHR
jgi:hypothetical protein